MNESPTRFSVIVPTRNRPELLRRCLTQLARLEYPPDRFELLVVDDGGQTSLDGALSQFDQRFRVRAIRQEHGGPASARNNGAAQATGQYLVFTDDDCAPAPDWLRRLDARFQAVPDAAIGGSTLNLHPDNVYSTASQLLLTYLYEYYESEPRSAFFASNNLALPAERFRQLGGYDARWPLAAGEDRELCDRWRDRGWELVYAPEAVVWHGHLLTFGGFCRQHFNYGRGAFFFHRARARDGRGPIRMEPSMFYTNLLRRPFRDAPTPEAVRLAALLLVSQVVNVAGFCLQGLDERLRSAPQS